MASGTMLNNKQQTHFLHVFTNDENRIEREKAKKMWKGILASDTHFGYCFFVNDVTLL